MDCWASTQRTSFTAALMKLDRCHSASAMRMRWKRKSKITYNNEVLTRHFLHFSLKDFYIMAKVWCPLFDFLPVWSSRYMNDSFYDETSLFSFLHQEELSVAEKSLAGFLFPCSWFDLKLWDSDSLAICRTNRYNYIMLQLSYVMGLHCMMGKTRWFLLLQATGMVMPHFACILFPLCSHISFFFFFICTCWLLCLSPFLLDQIIFMKTHMNNKVWIWRSWS